MLESHQGQATDSSGGGHSQPASSGCGFMDATVLNTAGEPVLLRSLWTSPPSFSSAGVGCSEERQDAAGRVVLVFLRHLGCVRAQNRRSQ
jgi:hypothetical protein